MKRVIVVAIVALLSAGLVSAKTAERPEASTTVSIKKPVKAAPDVAAAALFQRSCVRCHAGDTPAGGLVLDADRFSAAMVDVPSKRVEAFKLVDTAAPGKSYVLAKLKASKIMKGSRMPLGAEQLAAEEIQVVTNWIDGLADAARKAAKKQVPAKPDKEKGGASKTEVAPATSGEKGATKSEVVDESGTPDAKAEGEAVPENEVTPEGEASPEAGETDEESGATKSATPSDIDEGESGKAGTTGGDRSSTGGKVTSDGGGRTPKTDD